MGEKHLFSGQCLDQNCFWVKENHFTVDSVWMGEKPLFSGQCLDENWLWVKENLCTVDSVWMGENRFRQ